MFKYNYPNNKHVFITENTINVTPYTFIDTGLIWEFDSVDYFYSLISCDEEKTVLDIGAQSGLYALNCAFFPKLKYHAFEPYNLTYNLLLDNLKLNNINNVKCYNIALGNNKQEQILRVPEHNGLNTLGETPLRFDKFEEMLVKVDTIDNLFFEKNIPVDFIKCDTEGYEYFIIKGAEKTINKYHYNCF